MLPRLIDHVDLDQVGCIKGRYIGQNKRTIFDLMSYTDDFDLEAFITQVDLKKLLIPSNGLSSLKH